MSFSQRPYRTSHSALNHKRTQSETLAYRRLYMVAEVSAPLFGYTLDRPDVDVVVTLIIGTAYRAIAYLLLIGLNRSKQR